MKTPLFAIRNTLNFLGHIMSTMYHSRGKSANHLTILCEWMTDRGRDHYKSEKTAKNDTRQKNIENCYHLYPDEEWHIEKYVLVMKITCNIYLIFFPSRVQPLIILDISLLRLHVHECLVLHFIRICQENTKS